MLALPRHDWLDLCAFAYLWQLAGVVHILGHWLVAVACGIRARAVIPWQRFVPGWGWGWNLGQPHAAMMCHYDDQSMAVAAPWKRVVVGFAGPYLQLAFVVAAGTFFVPSISSRLVTETRAEFALCTFAWQLLYFVWYAIHYHNDPHSDFALLVWPRKVPPAAPAPAEKRPPRRSPRLQG